jgi:hypothetical protein
MQRKHEDGKRPRIGVSLDPEVYEWIKEFNGPSDSYTVSRILRAAMLAGLTLEEAKSGGVLEDFADWLARKRGKFAGELRYLLGEYLEDK